MPNQIVLAIVFVGLVVAAISSNFGAGNQHWSRTGWGWAALALFDLALLIPALH